MTPHQRSTPARAAPGEVSGEECGEAGVGPLTTGSHHRASRRHTEHRRPSTTDVTTTRRINMGTIPRRATPPETPHANDELLTIAEVAEVADVVRVPVATLRYWRSEVLQWLEKQSSHPQARR